MALRIVSGLSATNLTLSSYLDLAKNELRNAQIQNLSTTQIAAISSPVQGQFVYDSTLDKLKVYDGAAWTLVGAAADETTITLSSNTLTIKDGGVSAAKLASSAVTEAKIATGAVTNTKLGADAVTGAKIADNAIDSEHYTDGSIDTVHLANDAVTGAKIAALTVATGNIANLGVTSGKLADGAVGTAKIAADAVTSAKIADGQVDTEHLATDAVTSAKIADNSVDIARLNVTDGSNGQVLSTNGSGTLSFITPVDADVTTINLALRLSEIDTTHTQNVDSSDIITIGSSTNTPDVQVTGDLIVDGDLTVGGTTTTINSTTITVDDPVFTLGGDTAPSSDDNKDRGIEFRYHNGTSAKVGFFGYDDSVRKFVFISDATNTSEVFSGNYGDAEFGGVEAGTINATANLQINGVNISSTPAELNILDGATLTTSELNILDGVTATATELNIMDGVTSTTAEINKLDGFTGVAADLNYAKDLRATGVTTTEFDTLDGLTASTGELNKLDGATVTTAEINILDGVTASTAEINKLDGVTVSTSEINSVTSRAGRYYHVETSHGGGELQIPSSTHGLTFPFHVTVVDNSGNTLLAEITQTSGTNLITIQDLPAETIHVHITGGL
jgi:hypothetical protein